MIAMLGMYDMPALQPANDRFWQAIRGHLGYGPDHLTRDQDFWDIWQSPDLLMAQTCGMPFRARLHDQVGLIGTPDYDLPDCPAGFYQSVFVVHNDANGDRLTDFAGGTFAYNEAMSQSGWAGPMSHLQAAGIGFDHFFQSGGHANSAVAVTDGRADIAGLDALTWALLQEHQHPIAQRLRVLEKTTPTPGLPYITAKTRNIDQLAQSIQAAIDDLTAEDRQILHLKQLVQIEAATYLAVPTPPGPEEKVLART